MASIKFSAYVKPTLLPITRFVGKIASQCVICISVYLPLLIRTTNSKTLMNMLPKLPSMLAVVNFPNASAKGTEFGDRTLVS